MNATKTTEPPTLSRWAEAQRWALRTSSRATPSRRARTDLAPQTLVLLYITASLPPVSFRPGAIAAHTGLSINEVAHAVADLEQAGRLEPGSARTGRLGVVIPATLAALGLDGWGLSLDDVRADVQPAGAHVEQTDDDLADAFADAALIGA